VGPGEPKLEALNHQKHATPAGRGELGIAGPADGYQGPSPAAPRLGENDHPGPQQGPADHTYTGINATRRGLGLIGSPLRFISPCHHSQEPLLSNLIKDAGLVRHPVAGSCAPCRLTGAIIGCPGFCRLRHGATCSGRSPVAVRHLPTPPLSNARWAGARTIQAALLPSGPIIHPAQCPAPAPAAPRPGLRHLQSRLRSRLLQFDLAGYPTTCNFRVPTDGVVPGVRVGTTGLPRAPALEREPCPPHIYASTSQASSYHRATRPEPQTQATNP